MMSVDSDIAGSHHVFRLAPYKFFEASWCPFSPEKNWCYCKISHQKPNGCHMSIFDDFDVSVFDRSICNSSASLKHSSDGFVEILFHDHHEKVGLYFETDDDAQFFVAVLRNPILCGVPIDSSHIKSTITTVNPISTSKTSSKDLTALDNKDSPKEATGGVDISRKPLTLDVSAPNRCSSERNIPSNPSGSPGTAAPASGDHRRKHSGGHRKSMPALSPMSTISNTLGRLLSTTNEDPPSSNSTTSSTAAPKQSPFRSPMSLSFLSKSKLYKKKSSRDGDALSQDDFSDIIPPPARPGPPAVNVEGKERTGPSPSKFKHPVSVTYNAYEARYEGLPVGWGCVNRAFGIDLEGVQKTTVESYESKIPAVLEMLKRRFLENGGPMEVGIFRLSANKEQCQSAKDEIDTGVFEGCADVHILANLVKIYFRELPTSLLNAIEQRVIHQVAGMKDTAEVTAEMAKFPEPTKSVFLWLLDFMVMVVDQEALNKMGPKNVAIVLSPNLYSVTTENAMVALTMSQTVAEFVTQCLIARANTHHRSSTPVETMVPVSAVGSGSAMVDADDVNTSSSGDVTTAVVVGIPAPSVEPSVSS